MLPDDVSRNARVQRVQRLSEPRGTADFPFAQASWMESANPPTNQRRMTRNAACTCATTRIASTDLSIANFALRTITQRGQRCKRR
jgi:hypothetical protein